MPVELWIQSQIEDWDVIDNLIGGIKREFENLGRGGELEYSVHGEETFGTIVGGAQAMPPDMPPDPAYPLVIHAIHRNVLWDRIDNLYGYITRAVDASGVSAEMYMSASLRHTVTPS